MVLRFSAARSRMAALGVAAMVLAGCGSGSTTASGGAPDPSAGTDAAGVTVVASTNVWAGVAELVGGEHVAVSAIVADPAADPHSFQATAQNQLALSRADLVVRNGGGYDDFVDPMLNASNPDATVVNAVETADLARDARATDPGDTAAGGPGDTAAGGPDETAGADQHEQHAVNEHVWYDLAAVRDVATAIADDLSRMDPANTDAYQANLRSLGDRITVLQDRLAEISHKHHGVGVLVTEPLPVYLLTAAGLEDLTPTQFSNAIENESDVPADVLAQTLQLLTDHRAAALVYNSQTTGPQTEQVVRAAEQSGIPVVAMTETLPAGMDYISWMDANITELSSALGD